MCFASQLEVLRTYELFGNVQSICAARLRSAERDALFLTFMDAKLSVVEYDPSNDDLKTVWPSHWFLCSPLSLSFLIQCNRSRCRPYGYFSLSLLAKSPTENSWLHHPDELACELSNAFFVLLLLAAYSQLYLTVHLTDNCLTRFCICSTLEPKISMHAFEDVVSRGGHTGFSGFPIVKVDPGGRCAVMAIHRHKLVVIPLVREHASRGETTASTTAAASSMAEVDAETVAPGLGGSGAGPAAADPVSVNTPSVTPAPGADEDQQRHSVFRSFVIDCGDMQPAIRRIQDFVLLEGFYQPTVRQKIV